VKCLTDYYNECIYPSENINTFENVIHIKPLIQKMGLPMAYPGIFLVYLELLHTIISNIAQQNRFGITLFITLVAR